MSCCDVLRSLFLLRLDSFSDLVASFSSFVFRFVFFRRWSVSFRIVYVGVFDFEFVFGFDFDIVFDFVFVSTSCLWET